MAPTAIPAKRALASKEATLFKELLTLYETRQLKKGQKIADQILKRYPDHGETLCMKGLILTHLGKRDEGIELVKKGVRLDLTSHICWHVFGLIQKAEKNYEEALKSYTQALRFDKDNVNILRDAAQLQAQLRIYDGLVETRHTLLKIRPNLRQHWVGLAVAYHLNGNLAEAKRIMDHYERTIKNVPDYDVDHSETMLYYVRLVEDLGETSEALNLLDVYAKTRVIVDRTAIMEARARLLTKLKSDEAETAWRALIEHNSDCYEYYRGFLSNRGLSLGGNYATTNEERGAACKILRDFSVQLPRAAAPRRLALTLATGDDFKELIESYMLSGLARGVPSLFADIKTLYSDEWKREIIEDLAERLRGKFVLDSHEEPPTTYLWTLYFLAQHHSFLSRHARALSNITLALSHTPTLPELYIFKARVLKRAGDLIGATHCMNEARMLDGQDRFLNTKSAKYCFRAGLVAQGNEILGLFTKRDAASPGADLEEMQSMFYLIEEGGAHYRSGRYSMALKRYCAVQNIFDEIEDDQYDFHGYSLRKFTINIYLNLLKWEDQLRTHPTYVSAALSASSIYVAVFDDPSIVTASIPAEPVSGAEKKAKKKAAKKAALKIQEELKKAGSALGHDDRGPELTPTKDDDPDGLKLISVPDPLERAAKFLQPLATLASDNIKVWMAMYDVAVRRTKYLQAVRALVKARSLDAQNPELHIRTVDFRMRALAFPQTPPGPIGTILEETLAILLPGDISLNTFNSQYLQRHSSSPPAVLAVAKVSRRLEAPKEEIEATLFTTLGKDVPLDIENALSVLTFLSEIQSSRTDEYRVACDLRFELSTVFKSPKELLELQKKPASEAAVSGDEPEMVD